MSAPLFLAIDGGNSKTDVVIGSADGQVLAFVRGPGSSPHDLGVAGAMRLLDEMVHHARVAAGEAVTAGIAFARAAVFLAGADLPVEVERLQTELDLLGWAEGSTVDNDTFALLRTGTDAPDAVAVVCGAGINCVGRTADGRTARFASLGQISGDWGGGHHLAEQALWHAARGEDGRGPATALSAAVAAHFGLSTVEQVSAGLHLGEITPGALDPLCGLLFGVAQAGDEVARSVVAKQADEIVAMARVAGDRLGLLGAAHAVVLGGGVVRARHPLLHEPVLAGIRHQAPLATIHVVTDPPAVGAALLAMDGLDPPAGAEAALRAALCREPDPVAASA
jgi:N-acetylglucosamine kinase-like BadF-type ATPase